jgi:hypothetical protein
MLRQTGLIRTVEEETALGAGGELPYCRLNPSHFF